LKLSAALANTVTAIAYAEFENVIEVDRDRNVVFDFGVLTRKRSIASFDNNARETLTASSVSTLYPIAGVYSSAIPTPHTDAVVIGWLSARKTVVENISIRSDVDPAPIFY